MWLSDISLLPHSEHRYVDLLLYKGPIVSQVTQLYSDSLNQTLRLYSFPSSSDSSTPPSALPVQARMFEITYNVMSQKDTQLVSRLHPHEQKAV